MINGLSNITEDKVVSEYIIKSFPENYQEFADANEITYHFLEFYKVNFDAQLTTRLRYFQTM